MKHNDQSLNECINLCRTCADECITCARRCEDSGNDELIYCANLCRSCADACQKVIESSGERDNLLRRCAEACMACAEECARHKEDFCRSCREIAEKCGEKCKSLVEEGRLMVMTIVVEREKTSFAQAAISSGFIAGAVFLIAELLMVPLFLGGSIWAPPRMIGAIVLGEDVLPAPGTTATFDFGVLLAALAVHFPLSIIYASIIGFAVRKVDPVSAIIIGAIAGLTIYFINFYGFTALFPWFAMARNWVSIIAHLIFGIVAAWAFIRTLHPDVKKDKG